MTNNNTRPGGDNQRVCDRLSLNRKILFELDNGQILAGKTEDISPRGALMQLDAMPEGDLLRVSGTLFIISDEGEFSIGYPCMVARQKGRSIALEIDKKAAAAFGNYMTKELLGCQ